MAAILTGTPTVMDWGTSSNPAGQSITVPSDATAVYMFWGYWNSSSSFGLSSATLNGAGTSQVFEGPGDINHTAIGVAAWYSPATGTITLDPAWDATPSNKPPSIVVYVKDGDVTAWRDAVEDQGIGSATVSVVANSTTTDLVLRFDINENGVPILQSGWTSHQTSTVAGQAARVSTANSPGVSTTSAASQGSEDYATLLLISIPAGAAAGTTYQNTVSDQALSAEVLSAIQRMASTLSEAAAAGESWALTLLAQSSLTENTSASDLSSALQRMSGTLIDSGAVSDTFSGIFRIASLLSETGNTSDVLTVLITALANLSEGVVSSEALTSLLRLQSQFTQTGNVGDTLTSLITAVVNWAESAAASDTLSAIMRVQATLTESSDISDLFSSLLTMALILTESVDTSDAFLSVLTGQGTLAESTDASDTLSSLLRGQSSLTESAKATDSFISVVVGSILGAISEGGSTSDLFSALQTSFGLMSEGASASEVLITFLRMSGVFSEQTLNSDSFATFLRAICLVSESTDASDTFVATLTALSAITEGASVSDAWSLVVLGEITGLLADTADASDAFSAIATLLSLMSEDSIGADSFSSLLRTTVAITNIAAASDAFSSVLLTDFSVAISEGSLTADAFLSQIQGLSQILELGLVSEVFSSIATFSAGLSESLIVSESFAPILRIGTDVDDIVHGIDLFSVHPIYRAARLDVALHSDLWQSKMVANIQWAESLLALDIFSIPLSFNVGFIAASIQISAAIAGATQVKPAVGATLDINRFYNE